MKICAIVPAHNESRNIRQVVKALRSKDFDVVVIDDGSIDGTGSLARDEGATVIAHAEKKGKGASLRDGFEYALAHGHEAVITVDGDGQHDVSDSDQFVAQAKETPVSVIVGNRMSNSENMPFVRYCTNRFMSWLISSVCRARIPDTQCGYRYISCAILRQINLSCRDYEIETEILMKSCKKGFKVYNVPVKTIYRGEKSRINPLKDTLRFFRYFLKEVLSTRH